VGRRPHEQPGHHRVLDSRLNIRDRMTPQPTFCIEPVYVGIREMLIGPDVVTVWIHRRRIDKVTVRSYESLRNQMPRREYEPGCHHYRDKPEMRCDPGVDAVRAIQVCIPSSATCYRPFDGRSEPIRSA